MSDCLTILKSFSCIWCRTRMPFTLRILEHKVVPHCFFVIPGTLSFPLMSVFKIKWNKIFNKHENMYFYVINRTSTKEPLRKLHFTVPWSYILKKSYNNDQSKAIASDTDLAIRCTHTDSQSSRVWFPGNCNISSMIFNSIIWSPISNYQYSWLKWKQYGAEEKTCKTFIHFKWKQYGAEEKTCKTFILS